MVLHACWKRVNYGYEVWLRDYPKDRGSGMSLDEAESCLIDSLGQRLQTLTPLFEYEPPVPLDEIAKRFGLLNLGERVGP